MSFWDDLVALLFGRRKPKPATKPTPAPTPSPTGSTSPLPPSPPKPPPPVAAPQAAPPPPPAAPPPPPPTAEPVRLDLAKLLAADASRIGLPAIDAAARDLSVEPAALRAVLQVESAGVGFAPDGRPLILFEPMAFSRLTGSRFDAAHPAITQKAALGRTQADRWKQLEAAYALDPSAALAATSWGIFQVAGERSSQAGFASVQEFVADTSRSESAQLAAFARLLQSLDLVDELQRRDWEGFARIYDTSDNPLRYAKLVSQAYATLRPKPSDPYLTSLVATDKTSLTPAHYDAVAASLGCEPAALKAVAKVESVGAGFAPDGRPIILFEPHLFSRQTGRKFDVSHPHLSYPSWGSQPYPRAQTDRWAQLAEAYALDPEAAVGSASYGMFQILGLNFAACGFPNAKAFVADMAKSEERQLRAFEAFVRGKGLVDELQKRDWQGFAAVYNGPGQVEKYSKLLSAAYASFQPKPSA